MISTPILLQVGSGGIPTEWDRVWAIPSPSERPTYQVLERIQLKHQTIVHLASTKFPNLRNDNILTLNLTNVHD